MIKSRGIGYRVLKAALYSLYLFIAVFILLEVALRIYDPFKFRVRANRIILPANQKQIIRNNTNPKLDSLIIHTRNGLGFRGPDTTKGFSQMFSIFTVGGSTTECHFLSDGKTWPARLQALLTNKRNDVWVGNAGLDGHSTYGHKILLDDYIISMHPKMVIFLTGVNDIEYDGPSFFEKMNTKGAYPGFVRWVFKNSEIANIVVNLWRGGKAQRFNNTTQEARIPGAAGFLNMSEEQINDRLRKQKPYLVAYRERLEKLADACISNHIVPVFLTQPCLYGPGTDSLTHVNLMEAKVEEGMNGELLYRLLALYNNQVKAVCREKKLTCIDLAAEMPRNSLYYYDQSHYTNEGAERIAHIVGDKLREIIRRY